MKKRIVASVMALLLAICVLPVSAFAAGSLSNFFANKTYASGQFSDVSNQWYVPGVKAAYEYGLMSGTTPTTFAPDKNLTIAEALAIAASLNSVYNTGSASFGKGVTPWYQPYVDYALHNGIIQSPFANYTANATRSDMAVIFAGALPDEAMTPINTIADNAIPDVAVSYTYGPAVYKLYRAGVLTGSGNAHAYKPNDFITRAEVATIIARMAGSQNRQTFTISSKELTPTELAAKCAPAVFYIELLSKAGTKIGSGSGFFINSSGLAVTNYHVIKNMVSAKITTKDGKSYDVAGVVDYSEANDLALIQVNGTGFSFLPLGDSGTALTGAAIYAIGYPLGIDQTVTPGTISNASHTEDGVNYIMINASISHGSSGGALVDSKGNVIGVTSVYYSGGQNLNLAVPINLLSTLSRTKALLPLSDMFKKSFTYYTNYPAIPDFTSVAGTPLYYQQFSTTYQAQYYYYSFGSNTDNASEKMAEYMDQLDVEGFDYQGYTNIDENTFYMFTDPSNTWDVAVGAAVIQGTSIVMIAISPKQ